MGLSCRRYRECSEAIPEAFGLSSSSVSRRFIRASTRRLRELMEGRLDQLDIIEGSKVILGFIQARTENGLVCRDFLNALLERGLSDTGGSSLCDGWQQRDPPARPLRIFLEDML